MLVQWRYKIVRRFGRKDGEIIVGSQVRKFMKMKPRPAGLFLYKPSKRKYDYVDYTGRFKGQDVDVNINTCYLETLGVIKFVKKVDCDRDSFT
jgi:uncharacterized protein with WD repeat